MCGAARPRTCTADFVLLDVKFASHYPLHSVSAWLGPSRRSRKKWGGGGSCCSDSGMASLLCEEALRKCLHRAEDQPPLLPPAATPPLALSHCCPPHRSGSHPVLLCRSDLRTVYILKTLESFNFFSLSKKSLSCARPPRPLCPRSPSAPSHPAAAVAAGLLCRPHDHPLPHTGIWRECAAALPTHSLERFPHRPPLPPPPPRCHRCCCCRCRTTVPVLCTAFGERC